MPVDQLCASYLLRLTQRLSRLTFELHDVRTGRTRRFDRAGELAGFLDAVVAEHPQSLPTTDIASSCDVRPVGSGTPSGSSAPSRGPGSPPRHRPPDEVGSHPSPHEGATRP